MSDLAVAPLSRDKARSLTDEVKHDAERLWRKLVELYDGRAHRALGYSSWGSYFEAEFGGSDATAYRLLQSGRVMAELPMGSPKPATERMARELAPLLDRPEELRDAWAEASSNGEPTALKVREVVQRVLPPVSEEAREKQRRWAVTVNVMDGLAHFDRDPDERQAEQEAELIDQTVAATRGQAITPDRLRKASTWAALLADALERKTTWA